eukprot:jgi/Phyca11/576138/estExt2_Genewise1.C_PHYCAscaffold_840081
MRLLVALAGGDDGDTFVLEDAVVLNEKSSLGFVAEKKRIGDRIRMDDMELVQRSKALFHKPPVSLQEQADTPKRQRHGQDSIAHTNTSNALKMEKQPKSLPPWKEEVFFYNGTQEVNCGGQTQPAKWGEVSSITENSSWRSDMSLDGTEPWIARTYAWEDLGDRIGLHERYAKPSVREEKRSIKDLVIPDVFACDGCMPLEIHEEDLIE